MDEFWNYDRFKLMLPGKPPSTNSLYANRKTGGRIMTGEGLAYKNSVIIAVKEAYPDFTLPQATPFAMEITYWQPDHPLSVNLNKFDVDGCHKALIDAIFRANGTEGTTGNLLVDDCWLYTLTVRKRAMSLFNQAEHLMIKYPKGCTEVIMWAI